MNVPVKHSGVNWLGDIPAHWSVVQSRRLFVERNQKARPGDLQLTVSQKYGLLPQAEFMEREGRRIVVVQKGHDILKRTLPGDFVISMRSFQGGLELSEHEGCVSSAYVPLTPVKWVVPGYFRWVFKSATYIQALQATSDLVRDGQALRFENFAKVPLPHVPESEQMAIAVYLDRKTTRIDSLVTKKSQFIDLLREKRQALITQAVTKGLGARVPMKDSGVEWLGRIPAHWKPMALKHLVSTPITDGPHETPVKQDSGVPFISAEAVSGGSIDFSKAWGFISNEDNARFSKKYKPALNDIYMVKSGATTGVVAIVDCDVSFNIWSPLAAMRPSNAVVPRFLLHALRSAEFQAGVALNWSYGTQQNIGMKVLETLPVPTPPKDEQHVIATYLDCATSRIDALIAKTERSIELLREHRTALITAAVTGKIDLRASA
ncbi:restriction endonuclease subunit S [Dyella telluris]|uniref:Restriction endonuclease subunit S n=1 Tax=Dyella telluris TaxID=2763498 RepID=A0A7G8Q9M3_9GAMM|nr:restriction endonuclease subunit S [Dyella telluris]QNK03481.1 restriction endonuclease subunit S [Dyella telluris]